MNRLILVVAVFSVLGFVVWSLNDEGPGAAIQQAEIDAVWQQQISAVQKGKSTAIILPAIRITALQWKDLGPIGPLITELNLSGDGLAEGTEPIAACSRLKILHWDGPLGDHTAQALAKLTHLEVLDLPAADLSDAGLREFERHPSLRLLRLRSPRLTDQGLKSLTQMPALRWVHLIDVPVSDAGLRVFHSMPELQSLYLDGDRATDDGLSQLILTCPDLHFHRDQVHLPFDPRQNDGHRD